MIHNEIEVISEIGNQDKIWVIVLSCHMSK
jgi:hypothetical protein